MLPGMIYRMMSYEQIAQKEKRSKDDKHSKER